MTTKEILINAEEQEMRAAVLENGILEEFYVERRSHEQLMGNIYKGKVDSVLPGIGAAFVDLGLEKNGFLYLSDVASPHYLFDEEVETSNNGENGSHPKDERSLAEKGAELLKKGEELLVQVVKEPFGRKGARLTTHITLPGRYLVAMPYNGHVGVSKRIHDPAERDRLRTLLGGLRIPQGMGFIVRTVGQGKGKKEFARDTRYLATLWHRIQVKSKKQSSPSLVHEEHDLILRMVRDSFSEEIQKMMIDSKAEYKKALHFVKSLVPELHARLEYYRGDIPLFKRKGIEEEIEKIYARKVYLKSGAYVVIEKTEGLVAIDVNTGKFTGKKKQEDTAFKTNLEAADEIARQVRLRDIGGIIVIDFIDMEMEGHRRELFRSLVDDFRRDKAKTNILSISEIGVVEMTRQRMRQDPESVSYQGCPYCLGRGSVKSVETVSISAVREVKKFFAQMGRSSEAILSVHPDVAAHLLRDNRRSLNSLERIFNARITLCEDPKLHIEDVKVTPM
ncbi:MAG: Rne/Rng family ribonuclease [Candidatus Omnitrophica bacterium]|nr:Rne/Rng family ribonuclease [Candidatus Omnitrophota bacterium]